MNDLIGIFAIVLAFLVPAGIIYYVLKTRHDEMNAMIEKGMDVSAELQRRNATPFRLASIAIGVGLGLLLGLLIENTFDNVDDDVVYPASLFVLGGLGLLMSGKIAKIFSS